MVLTRFSFLLLSSLLAFAVARPGAPNYPTEDENIIPDYAYENEDENKFESTYTSGMKMVPMPNPDKYLDEEFASTEPAPAPETTEGSSTSPIPVSDASGVVRAVEAAGTAGAVGAVSAVQAVEVVKVAFETTENTPETTTEYLVESGRSASDTPTTDQTLYGFSKFLHDLIQMPAQVMRYLTGAFTNRSSPASNYPAPAADHALTSAIFSQSF